MGGWMMIFWIVLLVAVVAGVWFMITQMSRRAYEAPSTQSGSHTTADLSPEELLKQRYARGEIERDEYMEKLDDLRAK